MKCRLASLQVIFVGIVGLRGIFQAISGIVHSGIDPGTGLLDGLLHKQVHGSRAGGAGIHHSGGALLHTDHIRRQPQSPAPQQPGGVEHVGVDIDKPGGYIAPGRIQNFHPRFLRNTVFNGGDFAIADQDVFRYPMKSVRWGE